MVKYSYVQLVTSLNCSLYQQQLSGTKLIELRKLPPTEKAATSHLKRAYLQVSTIKVLINKKVNFSDYGKINYNFLHFMLKNLHFVRFNNGKAKPFHQRNTVGN